MIRGCGCKSINNQFEFPILDDINNVNLDLIIEEYYPNVNSLCELKNKVICEYKDIINKLNCGIQPDLEFLLQEISFIYIYDA